MLLTAGCVRESHIGRRESMQTPVASTEPSFENSLGSARDTAELDEAIRFMFKWNSITFTCIVHLVGVN